MAQLHYLLSKCSGKHQNSPDHVKVCWLDDTFKDTLKFPSARVLSYALSKTLGRFCSTPSPILLCLPRLTDRFKTPKANMSNSNPRLVVKTVCLPIKP